LKLIHAGKFSQAERNMQASCSARLDPRNNGRSYTGWMNKT
jgi:hypothetical protein